MTNNAVVIDKSYARGMAADCVMRFFRDLPGGTAMPPLASEINGMLAVLDMLHRAEWISRATTFDAFEKYAPEQVRVQDYGRLHATRPAAPPERGPEDFDRIHLGRGIYLDREFKIRPTIVYKGEVNNLSLKVYREGTLWKWRVQEGDSTGRGMMGNEATLDEACASLIHWLKRMNLASLDSPIGIIEEGARRAGVELDEKAVKDMRALYEEAFPGVRKHFPDTPGFARGGRTYVGVDWGRAPDMGCVTWPTPRPTPAMLVVQGFRLMLDSTDKLEGTVWVYRDDNFVMTIREKRGQYDWTVHGPDFRYHREPKFYYRLEDATMALAQELRVRYGAHVNDEPKGPSAKTTLDSVLNYIKDPVNCLELNEKGLRIVDELQRRDQQIRSLEKTVNLYMTNRGGVPAPAVKPTLEDEIKTVMRFNKVPCCDAGVRFARETGGHSNDHPAECHDCCDCVTNVSRDPAHGPAHAGDCCGCPAAAERPLPVVTFPDGPTVLPEEATMPIGATAPAESAPEAPAAAAPAAAPDAEDLGLCGDCQVRHGQGTCNACCAPATVRPCVCEDVSKVPERALLAFMDCGTRDVDIVTVTGSGSAVPRDVLSAELRPLSEDLRPVAAMEPGALARFVRAQDEVGAAMRTAIRSLFSNRQV